MLPFFGFCNIYHFLATGVFGFCIFVLPFAVIIFCLPLRGIFWGIYFCSISVSPFWCFVIYQSPRFGVLHIFPCFCWCHFFLLIRFAVHSETSGSHLREFTARWYCTFFLGFNFVGLQSLCDSFSCEGVLFYLRFLWTYFPPRYFLSILPSHVDVFASFPLLTAFRGKWFVRLILVYSMVFRSNIVHVFP